MRVGPRHDELWRRTRAAVTVLTVLAFAAACIGGSPGDTAPSGEALSGSGPVQAFDPDRVGPAVPIKGAVAGGTVTVSDAPRPSSIPLKVQFSRLAYTDPTAAYNLSPESILAGLVTRSLTQYVYDPEQGTMVVVPDIATDVGTPNADFTQWSFTIRHGVRFEDGTEVTAEDVAYGIKRSLDRTVFPDGPAYSNQYFLHGDGYKGVYTTGTSYDGVVVNGDTVTISMARPFPDMPYWATWPAMGPIPERGSDPATYGRHPLATGPYKFAHYTPGKSLTLVRNDQWDPNTDPGRHAYPDRWEFDFTAAGQEIDKRILGDSEQGQTTLSLSDVLPENYRTAQKLDRLVVGPGKCTYLWYPDYRKITDIRVREAIGYAMPYAAGAEARGEIVGVTTFPGTSVLPPGLPGRQQYTVLDTKAGRTDPDKAKALLQEAGWAPGEYELRFAVAADSPIPMKLVVTSLEAAGFKVTPRVLPAGTDSSKVNGDPQAPVNLRPGGWCSDWPSGTNWYPNLLQSDSVANWAHFDEPAVDAEIERIARLPIQEQPAAWGALDRSVMTDYYPAIVNYYAGVTLLHGSRIGGVNVDSTHETPTWQNIYVVQ